LVPFLWKLREKYFGYKIDDESGAEVLDFLMTAARAYPVRAAVAVPEGKTSPEFLKNLAAKNPLEIISFLIAAFQNEFDYPNWVWQTFADDKPTHEMNKKDKLAAALKTNWMSLKLFFSRIREKTGDQTLTEFLRAHAKLRKAPAGRRRRDESPGKLTCCDWGSVLFVRFIEVLQNEIRQQIQNENSDLPTEKIDAENPFLRLRVCLDDSFLNFEMRTHTHAWPNIIFELHGKKWIVPADLTQPPREFVAGPNKVCPKVAFPDTTEEEEWHFSKIKGGPYAKAASQFRGLFHFFKI